MYVTEVTVEIHEKRSHPHEYRHRDCSVRLTATVDSRDDIGEVVGDLRGAARYHVQKGLDAWLTEVDLEKAAEECRSQIRLNLYGLQLCGDRGCVEKGAETLRSLVHDLPWAEQAAATERVEAAVLEAWEKLPEAE